MAEEEKTDPKGPKKHRSPNYPYTGLEDAIEKTRKIQEHGAKFFVPFSVAMEAWGYKAGTTHSMIAALKAYGLIDLQGEGDKKQIKVSDNGTKILDNDYSGRGGLIKDAALKPTLHRELWDKWDGELPPSNKVITEYLKYEKHFNPTAVDGFVGQFRDVIAFAKLTASDRISSASEENDIQKGAEMKEQEGQSEAKQPPPPPDGVSDINPAGGGSGSQSEGSGEFRIHVLPTGEVDLLFTGKITKESVDILQGLLKIRPDILEDRTEKKEPKKTESINLVYPRQAMWKNKDHDQPVTVVGEAGDKDGKKFYKIKGSDTGIPEDELEFKG